MGIINNVVAELHTIIFYSGAPWKKLWLSLYPRNFGLDKIVRTCVRPFMLEDVLCLFSFKVARYSFSGSTPPKFEHKLRRHKQSFGKIDTTVVLDKDENLL